tara:strand:- start:615 stop:968 length:354 start_codon:yes stop_codon:yes gene_type:complete
MRGVENWYRNVDTPPNKKGKYILCPNCGCKTSRKNIHSHMRTRKCLWYDPSEHIKPYYREGESKPKQEIFILLEYNMEDNYKPYNYIYNLIVEEYAYYPLLENRNYFQDKKYFTDPL